MLLSLYTRMQNAWGGFRSRFEDETGAVATEYVFLLVLIALAITGGMIFLAAAINAKFSAAGTGVSGA
jgi:Flp pilus assembly pilin Flp